MRRNISAAEFFQSGVIEEITYELAQFTIGFVKLNEQSGRENIIFAGSGTLVKTDKHYGILTADHVLQNQVPNQLGLVYPHRFDNNPQRRFFPIDDSQKLRIGLASNTAKGPDLGFLILHPTDARNIEAKMSFYNLSHRRERMQSPLSLDSGNWFLSGGVAEGTTESSSERTFKKIMNFSGLCGFGTVREERVFSQFDYLDFEIAANKKYEGPMNFQGMSGGGLWQIRVADDNGGLKIVEYLLSGVAYYQIVSEGKPQKIICHGRRSIYDVGLNKLENL